MNSLNILSARVSPQQTPSPTRSNSLGNILSSATGTESRRNSGEYFLDEKSDYPSDSHDADQEDDRSVHEETPLLDKEEADVKGTEGTGWRVIPQRISFALIESVRWFLSTIAAPGVYLFAYLCDEQGNFAPFSQMRKLGTRRASAAQALGINYREDDQVGDQSRVKGIPGKRAPVKGKKGVSSYSSSSGLSSESDSDFDRSGNREEQSLSAAARHSRSKSLQASDEIAPARRSIRIKLHNEDSVRQRKHRKAQSTSTQSNGSGAIAAGEISPATLKSPTSPASSLSMTKYPRAPAPPRPLIPRRQPSYTTDAPSGKLAQKTLILDLDETLIHSMAKGGRMSTGHMVEVKLNTTVGAGGNAVPGPQHPILYYVHKRPHCDDFLRRICKWYNLVIFTASVQEYADPVIDFLETERKFFSGRYYRQHCTYRHGAFIKDLSSVEPDLSKVMILDNSPLSYMFHQDNAIPIEGWISDPTDNDLMHLVPLLEGLQYVTDVRAFLALRGGEDGKHIA
ncbi:related to nuclear envelope protein NEM1 [Rhynchosporium secalis]|uniref:Related to nuclear envelope protein NEM1 n=1 Tax=Rhynchosporium secalis TaxID=38038 RepID=A0A1E1M7I2_RHYSE|nr:related to nuclear envelope protein NEM1 [Rhynchosporium secalis]